MLRIIQSRYNDVSQIILMDSMPLNLDILEKYLQ